MKRRLYAFESWRPIQCRQCGRLGKE